MGDKFKNKYRIPSARLQSWDYSTNGPYFITICTKNRQHFFGEVINGTMNLNEIGLLAEQFWLEIPKHFTFVELGNFVIMPNHVHGILIINNLKTLHCNISNIDSTDSTVQTLQCNVSNNDSIDSINSIDSIDSIDSTVQTLQCNVSTATDNTNKNEQMAKISPKQGSISTIIRSYKSVVTKNAHFIDENFGWQPRFHDHIIRNAASFDRIQNYITNNPMNWAADKFY
ncbi:transposase [Flavobacterium psychrophilum]|nr:transposase [Flavobacterium psychrophilum]